MSSMLLNILTVFLIFLLSACSSFISPAVTFLFVLYFVASNTLQKFYFLPLNIAVIVILWSVPVLLISMCEVLLVLPLLLFPWSPVYVFFLLSLLFPSRISYYLWPVLISTLITICRNSLSKTKIHFLLLSWASVRTSLSPVWMSQAPPNPDE